MTRTLKITSVTRLDGDQKVVGRLQADTYSILVCTLVKLDDVSPVNLREFSETEIAAWEAATGLLLNQETFRSFLRSQYGR